jgi:hypothetical protein
MPRPRAIGPASQAVASTTPFVHRVRRRTSRWRDLAATMRAWACGLSHRSVLHGLDRGRIGAPAGTRSRPDRTRDNRPGWAVRHLQRRVVLVVCATSPRRGAGPVASVLDAGGPELPPLTRRGLPVARLPAARRCASIAPLIWWGSPDASRTSKKVAVALLVWLLAAGVIVILLAVLAWRRTSERRRSTMHYAAWCVD